MKQCAKCKNEFPATTEYFNNAKSRPDGLFNYCRDCQRAVAKARYRVHKDEILEEQRVYRQEHREDRIAYARQYYKDNKEVFAKKGKDYRETHKEELNQQKREYWARTKEERHRQKREYYQANKEYIKTKNNQYYHTNRETALARQKQYAEENKERVLANKRRYHQENRNVLLQKKRQRYLNDKPRINAKNNQWRHDNQHKMRVYGYRRMARKLALPNDFTIEQSSQCYSYWQQHCVYCGNSNNLTLDHYIPLNAKDCPGTIAKNMVPACQSCNCSKQDSDPIEWLIRRFGEDQAELIIEAIREYFASLDTDQH